MWCVALCLLMCLCLFPAWHGMLLGLLVRAAPVMGLLARHARYSDAPCHTVLDLGPQALCKVERQVVAWFGEPHPAFSPEAFPVFVLHDKELGYYYGFPAYGNSGLKIGERSHVLLRIGHLYKVIK